MVRRIHRRSTISLSPEDIKATSECLAKAEESLDFGIGTILTGFRQSGVEDKLTNVLIREVNVSPGATAPCLERDENGLWYPEYQTSLP